MARLNQRKEPRIATFLNLSQRCRDDLESAIGLDDIKTLTDAVEEAAKLLAAKVKKRASAKRAPDPS